VLIESPAEPQRSILSRILSLLNDWFLEPLLITRRFVYLFVVFVPVIATAPMLVLGAPEKRLDGDRWGAVWWYDFLVTQMARAGPTFIKVWHASLHVLNDG
jgi:aarF domain-containing kinase